MLVINTFDSFSPWVQQTEKVLGSVGSLRHALGAVCGSKMEEKEQDPCDYFLPSPLEFSPEIDVFDFGYEPYFLLV